MLRRVLSMILAALLLSLAACGAESSRWPALAAAREMVSGSGLEFAELVPGDGMFSDYVSHYYGIDPDSLADGAVLMAGGGSAAEAAALRFSDGDAAAGAAGELERYLHMREADFTGYMPAEADMVSRGRVVQRGEWCALIILPDPGAGEEAFMGCFGTEAPEEVAPARTPRPSDERPQESGWEYDEQRLLDAWDAGEWPELDRHDRAILNVCAEVLGTYAPESLGLYERELAIHDYIVEHAEYDSQSLSRLPYEGGSQYNTNPYGALVEGLAICSGYSSAFQLLMRMAGYECMTVHGEANSSRETHAWNMVRLGGEWYCVDVTWDDPSGMDTLLHSYFNVTSDYLREHWHFWDDTSVPEATGSEYAYRG